MRRFWIRRSARQACRALLYGASRGSWDGTAEPDPDRGRVDGAAPNVVRACRHLVATARCWRRWRRGAARRCCAATAAASEGRAVAPADPVGAGPGTWSAGWAMAALILRSRRCARIALLEYALSPSVRPGRVRGRLRPRPRDPERADDGAEGQGIVALPGAGKAGQRPAPESASGFDAAVSAGPGLPARNRAAARGRTGRCGTAAPARGQVHIGGRDPMAPGMADRAGRSCVRSGGRKPLR